MTWEPLLLVSLFVVSIVAMLPLVVQGLTCSLLVGEFTWPSADLPEALLSLTHGDFGSGLRGPAAEALPPDPVMWVLTGFVEITVLGGAAVAGLRLRDTVGPSPRHGLATSAQAAEALGIKSLRAQSRVIRPDLRRPHHSSTRDIESLRQ